MRHLVALLALLALLILLLLPGDHHASKKLRAIDDVVQLSFLPTHSGQAWGGIPNQALAKARAYWRNERCADPIVLVYRALPPTIVAKANWSTADPPTAYLNCTIAFGLSRQLSFAFYCAAMIHEYGHLHGAVHSLNPRNVMYPTLTARNIPATCKVKSPP